jgi:phosphoribosyl 1,2-cyclic phosphodiesterase
MRVAVLGSGSGGNAMVVEHGGRRILVDAGFSCREIEKRLEALGLAGSDLHALVLTHEHVDHVRGARRLCRRFGLPVYATAGTFDGGALGSRDDGEDGEEPEHEVVLIRSGDPCEAAGFVVEAFAIPHDAREPVGLVIEDGDGCRLGLVADLGTRSRLAWGRLRDLDVLVLETNHDLDMLRNGPYPWPLKQRVAGRHGHLSNGDAAEGLPELLCGRLRWVVCYHLSRTNNLPALAAAVVTEALSREGSGAQVAVTCQAEPTPWMEVSFEGTSHRLPPPRDPRPAGEGDLQRSLPYWD